MSFRLWKVFDEQTRIIRHLWALIGILILVNLVLGLSMAGMPKRLRVYLPPDISAGTTVRPGHIPKATLYAFAFQIFTAINTWTASGETDYPKAINAYRNYLTPDFYRLLRRDEKKRERQGELSRERTVSGVSGSGYQDARVVALGDGRFRVTLTLHIVETVGGSVVKDVTTVYPLVLVRVNESIQINPWGLAIAGFAAPPYRLKTRI